MARPNFKSIDDYESFLGTTIEGWTPVRLAAFAAAIAGRWLPCYETFSAEEDWGDPDALQRTMDAIWNHVAGKSMAAAEQTRRRRQLEEITPHMDDFDALDAMAACVILGNALDCCGSGDNKSHAILAALGGFEAAVPDWAFDPDEQPKLWKKVAARKELKKQLRVLERVGDVASFDEATIAKLCKDLTSAELIGETTVEQGKPIKRLSSNTAGSSNKTCAANLTGRRRPEANSWSASW